MLRLNTFILRHRRNLRQSLAKDAVISKIIQTYPLPKEEDKFSEYMFTRLVEGRQCHMEILENCLKQLKSTK